MKRETGHWAAVERKAMWFCLSGNVGRISPQNPIHQTDCAAATIALTCATCFSEVAAGRGMRHAAN